MGMRVPRGDRHPRQPEWIGAARHRAAESRAAAAEAGRLDAGAIGLGQVLASAEGIRERPHRRTERLFEILARAGDLPLCVIARHRAEIDMRARVRADGEAATMEIAELIPVHPGILDAAIAIPERHDA